MVPAISVFASGLYPHVEANPFSEFQRFDTVSAEDRFVEYLGFSRSEMRNRFKPQNKD